MRGWASKHALSHGCQQLASRRISVDICDQQIGHGLPRLVAGRADVGQQHHIVEREEILRHFGFLRKHIKPRAGNRAVAQGQDQGGFIDQ